MLFAHLTTFDLPTVLIAFAAGVACGFALKAIATRRPNTATAYVATLPKIE